MSTKFATPSLWSGAPARPSQTLPFGRGIPIDGGEMPPGGVGSVNVYLQPGTASVTDCVRFIWRAREFGFRARGTLTLVNIGEVFPDDTIIPSVPFVLDLPNEKPDFTPFPRHLVTEANVLPPLSRASGPITLGMLHDLATGVPVPYIVEVRCLVFWDAFWTQFISADGALTYHNTAHASFSVAVLDEPARDNVDFGAFEQVSTSLNIQPNRRFYAEGGAEFSNDDPRYGDVGGGALDFYKADGDGDPSEASSILEITDFQAKIIQRYTDNPDE